MNRRSFLHSSALSIGALSIANQQLLSGMFDDPWKIKMLNDRLGIFTEKGGTIAFVLSKDGIIVVDSQFPEQSNHLIGELKKRSEKPIDLLINTHHHGDHTSGNISFKGIVKHVLAHENSKANQQNVAIQNKSEDKQLYPDQTFGSTWNVHMGKDKITLYYYGAGHTNGDALIHFENHDTVHMGDLLFNRRHPFVDRTAGANMRSWINVLGTAEKKFDKKTTFIYGHSGTGYEVTGTREDLPRFADYLDRVLKFAESELKSGKTKEEILKATELPGETQWKGDGFSRPLQAAIEEITAKG
jgi:cyclase